MDAPVRPVPGSGADRSGGLSGDPAAAPGQATSDIPQTAAAPAAPETAAAPEARALDHLVRRLLPAAVLGLAVLAGFLGLADPRRLLAQLRQFDFLLLAPILALSTLNYVLRFARWELYLRQLGVALPRGRSLAVFLVGFLLSVTPGKAGELGKAWLVRELGGGPALRVAPAVLAERLTDLLGVLALLAVGALPFPGGRWWAAAGVVAVALTAALLTWEAGAAALLRAFARLPRIGRRAAALGSVYRDLRRLLAPRPLAIGLAVAVAAWGAEGAGFVLAVRSYAPRAGFLVGVFDYTASTTLGSASMLPGGLGAADGTLTALLRAQGLDTARAALVTLIVRGATLWYSVLLGLLALPFLARLLAASPQLSGRLGTRLRKRPQMVERESDDF